MCGVIERRVFKARQEEGMGMKKNARALGFQMGEKFREKRERQPCIIKDFCWRLGPSQTFLRITEFFFLSAGQKVGHLKAVRGFGGTYFSPALHSQVPKYQSPLPEALIYRLKVE